MSKTTSRNHRRTPNTRSLDLGALHFTSLDSIATTTFTFAASKDSPGMQRDGSDEQMLHQTYALRTESTLLGSDLPLATTDTDNLADSANRVKRSCSTSALSGFTASTANKTISEYRSVLGFSKKAKALCVSPKSFTV